MPWSDLTTRSIATAASTMSETTSSPMLLYVVETMLVTVVFAVPVRAGMEGTRLAMTTTPMMRVMAMVTRVTGLFVMVRLAFLFFSPNKVCSVYIQSLVYIYLFS